jgi:hypothetical protein
MFDHMYFYVSLGVKWQGSEAEHSPPTSAKVKRTWMYTCRHLSLWCSAQLVKHRDKSILESNMKVLKFTDLQLYLNPTQVSNIKKNRLYVWDCFQQHVHVKL